MTTRRRILPNALLLLAASVSWPPRAPAKVVERAVVQAGLEYQRHEDVGLVAHVLKLDLKAKGVRIRSLKSQGKETVRELVQRLEDSKTVVLGALNGDFFRQESAAGLPYGVQVSDGRLLFAPMKRSMIAFGPANEPYIGVASLRATLAFSPAKVRSVTRWTPIDDANVLDPGVSKKNGIYLYTPAFLELKLARPGGLVAVVEEIEPALQVGDVCQGRVARIETSEKPLEVPEAGCLLYFVGEAARALAAGVRPGHFVYLKLELPPIAGGVAQAIGGGPRLVRDGRVSVEIDKEVFDPAHALEISKRHPRAAIGYDRAKRFLYLVMVEGRHDRSRGMTFAELGEFLAKLGCYQAMGFDGGGSAAMYVYGRGIASKSMGGFNRPEEREIANAILVTAVDEAAPKPPPSKEKADAEAKGRPEGPRPERPAPRDDPNAPLSEIPLGARAGSGAP